MTTSPCLHTQPPRAVEVYFFSGTGNARRAALWVAEEAAGMGLPCRLTSLDRRGPPQAPPPQGTLTGFFFPVHGFTLIWAMLRFLFRFPRAQGPSGVFVAATLGGCKFGRVYVPGWEGSGLYLALLVLRLKGYRARGALPLRYTPENWTSLFPGYGEAAVRKMMERTRAKYVGRIRRLLSGQPEFSGRIGFLFGLAVLPVSLLYLLVGRFFLAKLQFATSRCTGCGECERHCPVGAIRLIGRRPYWKITCESCMRCLNFCPRGAVQSSQPFLLFLLWLIGLPVGVWLFGGGRLPGVGAPWDRWLFVVLVEYPWILLSISAAYWVWFWLLAWKPVNRLFEFTTLTRIYPRTREPDTRWSDFTPGREENLPPPSRSVVHGEKEVAT